MFSIEQVLIGETVRLIADSCQHMKKLCLFAARQNDVDIIHVIRNLESSWKPWSWMDTFLQMLRIHTLIIVPGNIRKYDVMSFSFLCSFYVFVNHVF